MAEPANVNVCVCILISVHVPTGVSFNSCPALKSLIHEGQLLPTQLNIYVFLLSQLLSGLVHQVENIQNTKKAKVVQKYKLTLNNFNPTH